MLFCSTAPAAGRFVHELKLSGDFVAIVSEGDFEPANVGTYSVRLYKDITTGSYIAGVTREREGAVKSAGMADINKDGKQEIVVVIESAGEGSFTTSDVFLFKDGKLLFDKTLSETVVPKSESEKKAEAAAAEKASKPESKPAEKPAEVKPAEPAPAVEAKPAATPVAEEKPAEPAPAAEVKPAAPAPAEEKPAAPAAEVKPVEPAPAAEAKPEPAAAETKPVVEPQPEAIVPAKEVTKPAEEPKAPDAVTEPKAE